MGCLRMKPSPRAEGAQMNTGSCLRHRNAWAQLRLNLSPAPKSVRQSYFCLGESDLGFICIRKNSDCRAPVGSQLHFF